MASSKAEDEDEDGDVEDLVSAINYNTITSMAALKEILGKDSGTSHEDTSWFQHYFLRHVNRLPSRSQYAGRRLSECKEEDENGEHAELNKQCASIDENKPSNTLQKSSDSSESTSRCSSMPSSPRKSKSYTTPHSSPRTSRGTSPHMDKRFFDVSLIEMKSQASSTSTLDYDSMDEVWVKRVEPGDQKKRDLGSSNWEEEDETQRSETWTAGHTSSQRIKGKLFSRERRKSDDEGSKENVKRDCKSSGSPPRKPNTIFDAFRPRSKSDATSKTGKKSGNIISQMKNAVQHSLMSPNSSGRSSASGSSSSTDVETIRGKIESGRNRSVSSSEATPIRQRTTSDSSASKGAVSKVMELFRHRSNSAVTSEDKRRTKAGGYYQHVTSHGAVLRRSSLDPDRKRLSLSAAVPHRGSDLGLDPAHAAILFRDSRGLPVADPFLEKVNLTDLEEDESQIFVKFFKFHKCYDLIPTSAKLVVFDTQLLVKKAFFALVDNGVRAAPLWDSVRQEFVGMLTITDFIKILQKYYTASNVTMDELEQHKLETWKNVLSDQKKGMISIGPDVSLYDAIKVLIHNRIHRLPVIDADTGNVLYILTHKRILRFLFLYINDLPKPSYMNKTLSELKIGTYENVETVLEDTTIILALKKFVERRVSALPIVDPQGRLVDIFAKFDVINLAAERTYDNLDITLKKANEHRNEWFEGVHRCNLSDTLFAVLEKIVKAEVHRLVVVNEEEKVIGILSLSDLLVFLVLRPCGDDKLNENCEESYECILMKEKLNNMSSSSNNKEDERRSSSQLYASRTNNNENSWKEIVLTTGQ